MDLLEGNLNNYFNMSLKSLRLLDFESAINFVDLAITHSNQKEFYRFQKVKILFIACSYQKCSRYIEANLTYFYKYCSLNIFSLILYYYQQSCKCSTSCLGQLLIQNHIPCVLAYEYTSILNKEEVNFLEQATDALQEDDYTTCIDLCDIILKQKQPPISAYLMKAKSHQILKQYDLAIMTYKKALILQPNLASIYYNLGLIMIALKQYAKAISYSQQALRIEPSNIVYGSLLAESFYKWRKYDSALISFKKLIKQNPNHTEAYLRIADIYNARQKPKKAKKYYKRLLQLKAYHSSN